VPAWDGVPRVDLLPTYLGAADSALHARVGAYTWTALAGRVLEPGCKADMVPVLISEEGTGKSSSVELMVPAPEHYVEIDLTKRDDDLSRAMRGKLIGELGELRGLQTRDEESIRAWVTRKFEEWTPKYREFAVKFARRLLFIGTANNGEFLPNDGSKARRWLPLVVGLTRFDALAADRDQLWAEARERFTAGGVEWREVSVLASEVRENHRLIDDWQQAIESWLALGAMDDSNSEPRGAVPVTTADVLAGAVGIPIKAIGRKEQERAARVLKALGYVRKKVHVQGKGTVWAYAPTSACKFLYVANSGVLDLA
jgi:predicted P-loop ATPase